MCIYVLFAYRGRLGCTIQESEQRRRADGASNGERIMDEGRIAAGGKSGGVERCGTW